MLRLVPALREEIERHGRDTYPRECCGFLIGTPGTPRTATRVHPLVNRVDGRAGQHRYEVDPLDWLRVERTLSATEQVIGIYHSHPDHSARPSELDRANAHPRLSYLIVAVREGDVEALRSWELSEARVFEEEGVLEAS